MDNLNLKGMLQKAILSLTRDCILLIFIIK